MQRTIEMCLVAAFISTANAVSVTEETEVGVDPLYNSCITGVENSIRSNHNTCKSTYYTEAY